MSAQLQSNLRTNLQPNVQPLSPPASPHTAHPSHGAPSLLAEPATRPPCLLDLMYDGFYLLFLLKGKNAPQDADTFRDRIKQFLTQFERQATRVNAAVDDIHLCKWAFCATVDEAILMSGFKAREAWLRQPLQLQFFGEQLAGEQFFERLEELRRQGSSRVQALEVFHMCLLLDFQGKYILEGSEKLNYLVARVGDEIAHHKGKRQGFAPHWAAPDRVVHQLKHEAPLWAVLSVLALTAALVFTGMRWHLGSHTRQSLAAFQNVVQLAPQVANVTITLP